jgi:hypothetical protein
MPTPPLPYQAFWCEENIWHLATHPAPGTGERLVLVITGAEAEVACWNQRAGRPGQPILWDYHVVLAVRATAWLIWDLDTRLGAPVPATAWLHGTFPQPERVREDFQPRFGVFTSAEWVSGFGSDRSHMRRADGTWHQPLPPWPPPTGQAFGLDAAIAAARKGHDLTALYKRLGVDN